MRRTRATLPTLLLAFATPFALAAPVCGFVLVADAVSQNDGPPGPGWREIKPPKSLWQKWRDGEDRRRQPPRPPPIIKPISPYTVPR